MTLQMHAQRARRLTLMWHGIGVAWASCPALVWASASTCGPTMNQAPTPSASPAASLASQAAQRVLAQIPANGSYPVLLQVGAGSQAEPAGKALRHALACHPRVVFSTVSRHTLPSVPDSSTAGGHVNPVADTVQPRPLLVLRVSESAGTLYIAARAPGADPLGPPDAGWLWVLQRP